MITCLQGNWKSVPQRGCILTNCTGPIATYVQQCMHTHHIHIHKYSDGSVVDVSCSRLVRYEERDKTPGLAIFRRGPATWVPIQAAKQEPITARTRSKTLNT